MKKILFAIFAIAIILVIMSYPASAACVVAGEHSHSEVQAVLLQKARTRIESTFGAIRSRPQIYFFDQQGKYSPLKLNSYGSTSFLGYKTCIAIGPDGQNINVIAHELMHAEIEERAGFWGRLTRIPVWFDEGLAMQVDYRDRYNLKPNENTEYVTKLNSSRQFFESDSIALTRNYAAAKSEVRSWLSRNTRIGIYENLSKIKRGASFDSIWE